MDKTIKKWGTIAGAAALTFAFVDAVWLEKYFFEVNTFDIGKKGSGKKVRLLLLTDLHFRKRLYSRHYKLANRVNELKPDLVLIAGDVVDETGTAAPVIQFLRLLQYNIPKVAIMGNHDHKSGVSLKAYREMYRSNNCTLLMNESKCFTIAGERVMITGLDDFIEGKASFSQAVEGVGREENHLLLIHSPKQQETVLKQVKQMNQLRNDEEKLNLQYIFAGHNHGGQIRIFGFAPVMPEKSGHYVNGWYNAKSPYLYVSKGFGTSTLPFRFGARAELTVFDLGV